MAHKLDKFIDTTDGAMKYTDAAMENRGVIFDADLFTLMQEFGHGPKKAEVIKFFAERRARDFMAQIAAVNNIGDLGWEEYNE